MSHRDTSVAIKQAITQALNVSQGHKRSYQTTGSKCHTGIQAINRSQMMGTIQCFKCHTRTQAQLSNKLSQMMGMIRFKHHTGTQALAIYQALNWSLSCTEEGSQPKYFNWSTITLHCNQSEVLILTNVFKVYMLQPIAIYNEQWAVMLTDRTTCNQ